MMYGISNMKKMISLLVAVVSTLTLSLSSADAKPIPPLQGLEMFRRCFSGMNDFTAEITQDKRISLMKRKMTASGMVRFRKPDTFYMELYSPYASRLLLRDTTITMILPGDGVRQKITLPREESLKRWFSYLEHPVKSLPDGVDVKADMEGKFVTLQIIPRKKGSSIKKLLVTFLETGGISRLVIEERNNDSTVINFRNMRRNTGLSEEDFYLE
jgi:outer membrane lipoprotein carrier protein